MPQIFSIGAYLIYFWSNENVPLEPIHVHVSMGEPCANSTKIWITEAGGCLLCNNASRIPDRTLNNIMDILERRSAEVKARWIDTFHEIRYFC